MKKQESVLKTLVLPKRSISGNTTALPALQPSGFPREQGNRPVLWLFREMAMPDPGSSPQAWGELGQPQAAKHRRAVPSQGEGGDDLSAPI